MSILAIQAAIQHTAIHLSSIFCQQPLHPGQAHVGWLQPIQADLSSFTWKEIPASSDRRTVSGFTSDHLEKVPFSTRGRNKAATAAKPKRLPTINVGSC